MTEDRKENPMRVFLAGATGAIGRRLVPQLVAAGHEVTATTTSAKKVDLLRELGASPVVVDGLDAAAVGEAVARAQPDAIVHQMTALSGGTDLRRFDRAFATTNELRTKGTENLLDAARAAGAGSPWWGGGGPPASSASSRRATPAGPPPPPAARSSPRPSRSTRSRPRASARPMRRSASSSGPSPRRRSPASCCATAASTGRARPTR